MEGLTIRSVIKEIAADEREMTVGELHALKDKLAYDIEKLILRFEARTGGGVASIHLHKIQISGERTIKTDFVSLKVQI